MLTFKIEKINPADPNDKRGNTFEWKFEDGRQITIYYRKRDCEFGNHYHKGRDPSKNPEKFFIIQGKIRANFITPQGKRITKTVKGREVILIYPNLVHSMKALEDTIFIEYRITHFDKNSPDTYSIKDK